MFLSPLCHLQTFSKCLHLSEPQWSPNLAYEENIQKVCKNAETQAPQLIYKESDSSQNGPGQPCFLGEASWGDLMQLEKSGVQKVMSSRHLKQVSQNHNFY